ncbi:putative transcriptional regulator [Luteibacter sp. W1I16]|uniref:helix-turn-helix domain-containing protein n=1 Tax=Luteibacter sp. W1I16 TaxID=3373922 RepID=UPI003D19FC4E
MYHYLESGLPNIWLKNGYVEQQSPYGKTIAIDDLLGLHRTIALALVEKPRKLNGAEIRFLRTEMELSQSALAGFIGVSAQSIALWEKDKSGITGPAEKLIRLIVKGHFNGNATIRRAIDVLNGLDAADHQSRLIFQEHGRKWSHAA